MNRPAKLSNNKKRKLRELVEQAVQALLTQQVDVCEQLCGKIESLQPGNADVANIRGVLSIERGDLAVAEGLFVQAINAAPRRAEFHENLGKLYLHEKLYADAAARYRSAMQFNPDSLQIKLGYCSALTKLGPSEEALEILQGLRKKHPHQKYVLMGLYEAYSQLDRLTEALACLDELIANEVEGFEARLLRTQLLLQLGRTQAAELDLRAALSMRPYDARANAVLAKLKTFTDSQDADVLAIEACYKQCTPESDDRIRLCHALGKVYADLQQYERSFAYFEEYNSIRLRRINFDADAELAHMEAIMSFYTPQALSHSSSLEDDRPVFIVGMPRCGSGLVEKILAAHPDVSARGEWEAFESGLSALHSPDNPLTLEKIISFDEEQWCRVGQSYLDRLERGEPGRRITDITHGNIRMLGAIHCALPQARIIHVRRNPLDTCLSIYTSDIQGGQFNFGLTQGTLGYYYRMYQRLMQHWREVLPEGVMYELDYEALVANQEDETRKLQDFCGLDWNDSCLNFQKANAPSSPNNELHRSPLFSTSVERWRRYENHLQPLIRILGTN